MVVYLDIESLSKISIPGMMKRRYPGIISEAVFCGGDVEQAVVQPVVPCAFRK